MDVINVLLIIYGEHYTRNKTGLGMLDGVISAIDSSIKLNLNYIRIQSPTTIAILCNSGTV